MTGLGTVNEGETVKPAADPRERRPDDAALDELRKAFGGTDAPAADDGRDAATAGLDAADDDAVDALDDAPDDDA